LNALAAVALAAAAWIGAAPSTAQETAPSPTARPEPAVVAAEDGSVEVSDDPLLTDDELDELVAPVALFPDALLSQVLVASTYPLELVKAERWVHENADLEAAARIDAATLEPWDPSVITLAAGFPTVVERMAADLDWTEALGAALIAQNDDVLDAVQRQRARAAATGALTTNAAQTVVAEDDTIAIEPTEPGVVYVPSYDPALVYGPAAGYAPSEAAPAAAYPPPTTVAPQSTVVVEEGYSDTQAIVGGLLAFGAGMLVNEVFWGDDDDDDFDWDDWDGPNIDWDDGDIYDRPGRGDIEINGDVIFDNDGADIDRPGAWRPTADQRDRAGAALADRRATRNAMTPDQRAAARDEARERARDISPERRESLRREAEARRGGDPAERSAARARERDRQAALTPEQRAAERDARRERLDSRARQREGERPARAGDARGAARGAGPAAGERPAVDRAAIESRLGGDAPRAGRARDDGQAARDLAARRDGAGERPPRDRAARTGLDRPQDGLAETRAARARGQRSADHARPARPATAPNRDRPRTSPPRAQREGQRRDRAQAVRGGGRSAMRPDRGGGDRARAQRDRGQRSADRGGQRPRRNR
jgi:hypothetical protein